MERKERAPGIRSRTYRQGMEAVERRRLLAAHVIGDSTVYTTIQAAVDAAPSGATVTVDPGTYQELVRVNKSGLTVKGAQAGVDGRTPSRGGSGESVVRGEDAGVGIRTSSFYVTADDVTIDGFTVQDSNSNGQFGGGIVLGPDVDGSHVLNNIVKNNATGLILANHSATDPAVIAHNLFLSNNLPGQHTGRAIYTDGGFTNQALANVVIDDNTFTDNHGGEPAHSLEAAIGIEAQATSTQTHIAITNNIFDFNGKALLVTNASDMTLTGNIVYNTRDTRSGALRFEGGVHDVIITGNTVYAGNARGIRIDNVGAPGPNFNFTITGNNLFQNGLNTALGVNHDALFVGIGQFSGQLDARNNWWGDPSGPSGDGPGTGDGLFANGNDGGIL